MMLSMTVAGIATYMPRQETLATQTWRERPSPSLGSAAASSYPLCHFHWFHLLFWMVYQFTYS
jgi:hypothetical protein